MERIYVVEAVADAFIDALVAEARSWSDRIGPLVDARQREHVHQHVTDAVNAGARLLIGGELPTGPGLFYPPTVPADCTPQMRVFREETFGPIAAVRVVADFDTALAEAADDRYGLARTWAAQGRAARLQRAWPRCTTATPAARVGLEQRASARRAAAFLGRTAAPWWLERSAAPGWLEPPMGRTGARYSDSAT